MDNPVCWQRTEYLTSIAPAGPRAGMDRPVIAVAGRSNAGKSSLLNRIFARKSLAKTSKTPGKTRLIHVFMVDRTFLIADLPGYGFAKVSKREMAAWRDLVQSFLLGQPRLKLVLVLMDVRHAPKASDLALIEWLNHHGIRWLPVLTKADKLARGRLAQQVRHVRAILGCDPLITSSKDGRGVEELRARMLEEALGCAPKGS